MSRKDMHYLQGPFAGRKTPYAGLDGRIDDVLLNCVLRVCMRGYETKDCFNTREDLLELIEALIVDL